MDNKNKIILDLCGGTGSWSAPYKEAGYRVINVTLPYYDVELTQIKKDKIVFWSPRDNPIYPYLEIKIKDIYGILAAPPCTMFSDARTNAKTPRDLRGGFKTVRACLEIIEECMYHTISDQQKYSPLKFWALENPWYGRLKWFLGNPVFTFTPWEFGHNYKKKTALWGYFKEPIKTHKLIDEVMTNDEQEKSKTNSRKLPKFDYMTMEELKNVRTITELDSWKNAKTRQALRSITPRGFAQAFFKSNQ